MSASSVELFLRGICASDIHSSTISDKIYIFWTTWNILAQCLWTFFICDFHCCSCCCCCYRFCSILTDNYEFILASVQHLSKRFGMHVVVGAKYTHVSAWLCLCVCAFILKVIVSFCFSFSSLAMDLLHVNNHFDHCRYCIGSSRCFISIRDFLYAQHKRIVCLSVCVPDCLCA